jgi:hypothetical protein
MSTGRWALVDIFPHDYYSDRLSHPLRPPRMSLCQIIPSMTTAGLPETSAGTVHDQLDVAIKRMEIVALDCYDNIASVSLHWISDTTGGDEDSVHFGATLSTLGNIDVKIRPLLDEDIVSTVNQEIISRASTLQGNRRLFILHYAGHGIASAPSNTLVITSRI